MNLKNYDAARRKMVRQQLAERGITDQDVLAAMKKIPRHKFIPPELVNEAYHDTPLPIECGQTISQPYIVASMTEHLKPDKSKTVFEIGTGSGYQTAVLAELFKKVVTVEYFEILSRTAQAVLNGLGYDNISFYVGDGLIVPDDATWYDAIIVTAAPAQFPDCLQARLHKKGRMIIPVGSTRQELLLVQKDESDRIKTKTLFEVRFVPLRSDSTQ